MTTSSGGDGDERPPSWAGAPGFVPYPDNLPPHAPMPGAPPYPAGAAHPPAPVGAAPTRTSPLTVLAAAAVWALLNVLAVVLAGLPDSVPALAGGLVLTVAVTAAGTWVLTRRRGWSFGVLVLVTAPVFWVLRAVVATLIG